MTTKIGYDRIEKREVAVKSIALTGGKAHEIENLRTQAEFLKKCESPHIIKLHDAFELGNIYHMVFEYAPMGDLWNLLNHRGVMCESTAAQITRQVLLGLHYLHFDLHVIHW